MDTLKVHSQTITLVDQVEDKLLNYLKEKDIRTGDSIPNELELAAALGVARSVLREALSRLKMMGMIETRTRRGMILTEPTILGGMKRVVDPRILGEEALFDILGFRIALEIGICSDIFRNITPEDISELEEIVKMGAVITGGCCGTTPDHIHAMLNYTKSQEIKLFPNSKISFIP